MLVVIPFRHEAPLLLVEDLDVDDAVADRLRQLLELKQNRIF